MLFCEKDRYYFWLEGLLRNHFSPVHEWLIYIAFILVAKDTKFNIINPTCENNGIERT